MKLLSIVFFTAAFLAIAALSLSNLAQPVQTPPESNQVEAPVATTTAATSTEDVFVIPENTTSIFLKAFGKNDHGQLTGAIADVNAQKDISFKLPGELKDIKLGKSHSLALTANGYVYSWGANEAGQLGRKTATDNETKPAIISGLTDIISISTTHNHSLALSKDGKVFAWGQNYTGQLGNGNRKNSIEPIEVQGLPKIKAVTAGHKFSLALAENGTVYAWGGSCDTNNKEKAMALLERVGGQLTSLEGGYYDSTASGASTYDISQDCLNEDAVNIKSPTPIKLDVSNVKSMSAGYGHALFLLNNGTVVSMGCNTFGQAGRTPGERKGERVVIDGLTNIVQVAAGARHSLFLDASGNLYAVGSNTAGQVGDRSRIDKSTPVLITEVPKAKRIYAGYDYSLAVAEDGSMWAWGWNNDEFFFKSTPMRVDFPMKLFEKAPVLTGTGGAHVIFEF